MILTFLVNLINTNYVFLHHESTLFLIKTLFKMKAKKIIFGLMACLVLVAVSCEPNNTSDEDDLYEVGIRKDKVKPKAG